MVIKLYLKGYTYREIAKIVHMSIRDISTIIREYRGEGKIIQPVKEKSMTTKAFQHFLENKSLIEMAIELDLPSLEVERMYDDFVRIRYRHLIPQYYSEIKQYFTDFIKYYRIVSKTGEKEINKVKLIIDNDFIISQQESRIHHLDLENQKALEFKIKLEMHIQRLREQYEFYCNQNMAYNTR